MELQEQEKQVLGLYAFVSGMYLEFERIEARKAINEDLNDMLEEDELSKEEYNTMQKELDEIDQLQ